MARFQSFARDLQLATAGMDPRVIAAELAAFAKSELAKAISSGEGSASYERYVNGRYNAPESSVVPPGPIVYDFNWWNEIVEFALQSLVERSPKDTGRFRQHWTVRANGQFISNPTAIPVNAVVEIVNTEPYSRKIEVGHMRMRVPSGVVEDIRKKVISFFGNMVRARTTMIRLPGGYILKGHFRRGYKPYARKKLQKDTKAGAEMTYPTLRLELKA